MNELKEDQTNLIALVALLISTAGFKEELMRVRLGSTSFTLFTVFVVASIAFGLLLYIHLLLNARLLLLKAWRAKRKLKSVVLLRLLFILILTIIPFFTLFIVSSNWFTRTTCTTTKSSESIFGSFPTGGVGIGTSTVCRNNFIEVILPLMVSLLGVSLIWWLVSRKDRKWNKLDPELKTIKIQISEYRILQSMSSSTQAIDTLQKKINKLEAEFKDKSKKK